MIVVVMVMDDHHAVLPHLMVLPMMGEACDEAAN
jgi:hypothetical protein